MLVLIAVINCACISVSLKVKSGGHCLGVTLSSYNHSQLTAVVMFCCEM